MVPAFFIGAGSRPDKPMRIGLSFIFPVLLWGFGFFQNPESYHIINNLKHIPTIFGFLLNFPNKSYIMSLFSVYNCRKDHL